MTTANKKLTPKQAKVLDLLSAGDTPAQVAKKMNVSSSGVYGHIRNIRMAGYTIPGESLDSDGAAPALSPASDTPSTATVEAPTATIATGDSLEQLIDYEITGVTAEIATLALEMDELKNRLMRLTAAREALG